MLFRETPCISTSPSDESALGGLPFLFGCIVPGCSFAGFGLTFAFDLASGDNSASRLSPFSFLVFALAAG